MNTPEQAPNPLQEQMVRDIDVARKASQEAGSHGADVFGSATPNTTTLEFINSERRAGSMDSPYIMVDSVKGNEAHNKGDLQSQKVFAASNKLQWNHDTSQMEGTNYHVWSSVKQNANGRHKEKVVVNRVAQNGEEYTHTFKNPDTARKFGSLIAKQVARRAQNNSESKAA